MVHFCHTFPPTPLNSALNPTCILLIPIITTDGAKQGVNNLFGDPKVILSPLLFHLPLCHASTFDTSLTKSFPKVNASLISGLLVYSSVDLYFQLHEDVADTDILTSSHWNFMGFLTSSL
jgi:hypothetical protein